MFKIIDGDIFQSKCDVLVNPISCSGLASGSLQQKFYEHFHDLDFSLTQAEQLQMIQPGTVIIYDLQLENPKYIFSIPTRRRLHDASRIIDISRSLDELRKLIEIYRINSIAIPALGCGLGRLEWEDVEILIREKLKGLRCVVELYKPHFNDLSHTPLPF